MGAEDFNRDGNPDILLNGNSLGSAVQVGNYDALNGLLFKGQGNGSFTPAGMKESGIFIAGDGKALVKLQSFEGKYMVAATQNRDSLKLFRHWGASKMLATPWMLMPSSNWKTGAGKNMSFTTDRPFNRHQ